MPLAPNDFQFFPKGEIATGGGSLEQVTNLSVTTRNGLKTRHSLRRSPSGFSLGNQEVSVSFQAEIPESGSEEPWFNNLRTGERRTARIKIPGEIRELLFVVGEEEITLSMEDGVTARIQGQGAWAT